MRVFAAARAIRASVISSRAPVGPVSKANDDHGADGTD